MQNIKSLIIKINAIPGARAIVFNSSVGPKHNNTEIVTDLSEAYYDSLEGLVNN